jgi:hypothetical protein
MNKLQNRKLHDKTTLSHLLAFACRVCAAWRTHRAALGTSAQDLAGRWQVAAESGSGLGELGDPAPAGAFFRSGIRWGSWEIMYINYIMIGYIGRGSRTPYVR